MATVTYFDLPTEVRLEIMEAMIVADDRPTLFSLIAASPNDLDILSNTLYMLLDASPVDHQLFQKHRSVLLRRMVTVFSGTLVPVIDNYEKNKDTTALCRLPADVQSQVDELFVIA
ncbi:hypothetical protein N0V88_006366 [Collariella sp. IMI 366227]|nr:hypothetical protein N0V88_006366 [Collariella sp. IMI 366227]